MSPVVTAIVVNFNGHPFVLEAVESLLVQDLGPLEIVVVDNASTDGSDVELERRFGDRVRLLRSPRNEGFGAGNNRAIRATRAPYVVLLNSDAVAEPGFARALVEAARLDDRIGMVAAKVLDYDRREIIDTVGHLIFPDGQNRGRGRLERDRGQFDSCRQALFPSGAACLYRRAMLEDVGLYDESFFLYADDAELGLRGRLAGWQCGFTPEAVAYHRYSQTAGTYSPLKAFYVERNRIWLVAKLFPLPLVLLSPLFTVARFLGHGYGALTGRGAAGRFAESRSALELVSVTARAQWAAVLGLRRVWGERSRLRPLRRLGLRDFMALLLRHRMSLAEVTLKD